MTTVGLALTIGGIFLYLRMDELQERSLSAEGVVVEMRRKSNGNVSPVVEFFDGKGERHEFVARSSSNPPRYKVADSVEVIYTLPESGTDVEAYINSPWNVLFPKFGLLAFGLLFLVLGLVFGRVFWNRDSMSIGSAYSKTVEFSDSSKKSGR